MKSDYFKFLHLLELPLIIYTLLIKNEILLINTEKLMLT